MVSESRVRCRQIFIQDFDRVAELLSKGFEARSRSQWLDFLQRISRHPTPEPFPKFGYLLEADGSVVGVLLTIFTEMPGRDEAAVRCNLSSWYVEPGFRNYASLLTANAQKYSGVTYVNTSPGIHTWPIIEAQGFRRFTDGQFIALTGLTAPSLRTKVHRFGDRDFPKDCVSVADYRMLKDHHEYGCLCLCCEGKDGCHPFIFRPRTLMLRSIPWPCAHAIFCNSIEDLSRFAGAISRFLLFRRLPFMTTGACAPIPNFVGRYLPERAPMYYRGPDKPQVCDLTYTEKAIFGMGF